MAWAFLLKRNSWLNPTGEGLVDLLMIRGSGVCRSVILAFNSILEYAAYRAIFGKLDFRKKEARFGLF